MSKIRVCIFPISHWRAARIFFSFLVFSGTQSHLHARKISTLTDQPSMFIEKNTHFCCIIHLKIISYKNSVSSTPLAKKSSALVKKCACNNFALLKILFALISIACAIVQCNITLDNWLSPLVFWLLIITILILWQATQWRWPRRSICILVPSSDRPPQGS